MMTTPRTVLVTGASRGIGRATAMYLANAGMSVFAGIRKREDGTRLEEEGRGRIHSVLLDVTDDESIEIARGDVERVVGRGGLGGLVNNAGIGGFCPMEHVTRPELEQMFQVNFYGVVLTTKAFLPLLRKASGRVVNLGGGGAGRVAIPLLGVGCATKFAVEGMTDALRVELRRAGVRVSLVEPGMTYSEFDRPVFRDSMNAALNAALERIPEEQRDHYGPAMERIRGFNLAMLKRAAPPERVARSIHHALTARRPKARYWCGPESKLAALFDRVATAGVRDLVWGRITGF